MSGPLAMKDDRFTQNQNPQGVNPTASSTPAFARVHLVQGQSTGTFWEITSEFPEAQIVLGSGPGAQWVITGQGVADLHCELFWDGERLWVGSVSTNDESLSPNGLFLNGYPVAGWLPIAHGSELAFGIARMVFETSWVQEHGQVDSGYRANDTPDVSGVGNIGARPGAQQVGEEDLDDLEVETDLDEEDDGWGDDAATSMANLDLAAHNLAPHPLGSHNLGSPDLNSSGGDTGPNQASLAPSSSWANDDDEMVGESTRIGDPTGGFSGIGMGLGNAAPRPFLGSSSLEMRSSEANLPAMGVVSVPEGTPLLALQTSTGTFLAPPEASKPVVVISRADKTKDAFRKLDRIPPRVRLWGSAALALLVLTGIFAWIKRPVTPDFAIVRVSIAPAVITNTGEENAPLAPADDANLLGPTAARQAADMIDRGELEQAVQAYRGLARRYPEKHQYEAMVNILNRKLDQACDSNGYTRTNQPCVPN